MKGKGLKGEIQEELDCNWLKLNDTEMSFVDEEKNSFVMNQFLVLLKKNEDEHHKSCDH